MTAAREWYEKDYYKALGLSQSASAAEIKTAYRKLSKQYHPDAANGDETRFKGISSAYDVLGDPDKRKEYDEVRRLGPMAGGGAGPFGGAGGFNPNFGVDDLGDILGGLFNRGRARGPQRSSGPRRGANLETTLHLEFADAVKGVTTSVNVTSDASCGTCSGTGAAPGTSPVICGACGGRGVRDDNQGMFSFSTPCRECGGSGMRIETPCATCGGNGVVHRPRAIKVRIPAGVAEGQRIRVKGRGGAGANGGPAGDLFVNVKVSTHRLFGRKGRHLTLTAPLTFAEAVLGATITVPTLDGSVTLRVPEGTASGRTFRVKGRGAPVQGTPGDLLVTVEVAVPSELSEEEREAIEHLGALSNGSVRSHLGVDER
ncbi:MAG: molecular chaperone DnaJ [Acidimicrobiales bacterium]